jgi:hypothetical protein
MRSTRSDETGDERQMNKPFRFGLAPPDANNKRKTDMTVLNIPKTLRAAAVAVALAGTAFTAMPAQASHFNSHVDADINFRFGFPGFSFRFGDDFDRRHCISDRQVRRDLRRDGYREIRFIDRRGRYVQVVAELGNRDYIITYDTCRQRIVDRDRIRRR